MFQKVPVTQEDTEYTEDIQELVTRANKEATKAKNL